MPEEYTLMCIPVSSKSYVVPGSIQDKCCECGQPVWVAPSSLLLIHAHPEIKIRCNQCAFARMKKPGAKGKIEGLIPAQIDEINQYFKEQENMKEEKMHQIVDELFSFLNNKGVNFICYVWDKEGEHGGGCQSADADTGDAMVTISRIIEHFNIDPESLSIALKAAELEMRKD